MKKFAWMFAALALCAGSMVACGGDDKKANGEECTANTDCQSDFCSIEEGQEAGKCADKTDSSDKKANGEACENNDECQSGNCAEGDNGKTCAAAESSDKKENGEACESADDCTSGYCDLMAESPVCADEPECDENADCENNEEGKLVCNIDAGKCVECLADNAVDAACDGSKPGQICVANVCSKCTDNAQCGEGNVCDADGQCVADDGNCFSSEDCKDPAKPYCGDNYKCTVAPSTSNCGECAGGVCVGGTTCVPAVTEGDTCDATFVTRCDGLRDILICDGDATKVVTKKGCKEGYTCQETLAGYAECVEECTGDLKEGDIQYADCDEALAYRYICRPAYNVADALFAFETIEDCSATDGKTCSANVEKTEALCVAATPAE